MTPGNCFHQSLLQVQNYANSCAFGSFDILKLNLSPNKLIFLYGILIGILLLNFHHIIQQNIFPDIFPCKLFVFLDQIRFYSLFKFRN